MRWTPGGNSPDLEDRRGEGGPSFAGFGGRHMGIGGTLVLLVLSFLFRQNLFTLFSDSPSGAYPPQAADRAVDPAQNTEVQFVSFVLDDVQQTWEKLLPQSGVSYRHAKLVLFRDQTDSSCGTAESATGPFY